MTQPMDYAQISRSISALAHRFPCLRVGSLGKSLLGKELFTLELFPNVPKTKPPLLFTGAFHGMEWITAGLLLRFAEDVCKAAGNMERGLVIAPCINPDGVDIQIHGARAAGPFQTLVMQCSGGNPSHWQANARGVDLNHNFDAGWQTLRQMEQEAGITGPSPTRFGGRCAESEPESRALVEFCRRRPFAAALALHSQGEEIYYRFGDCTPPGSVELARAMSQASGYAVADPEGLASLGGFKDWFIQEFFRPGFTVEVGKGENPLPLSQFDSIYQSVAPMLQVLMGAGCL